MNVHVSIYDQLFNVIPVSLPVISISHHLHNEIFHGRYPQLKGNDIVSPLFCSDCEKLKIRITIKLPRELVVIKKESNKGLEVPRKDNHGCTRDVICLEYFLRRDAMTHTREKFHISPDKKKTRALFIFKFTSFFSMKNFFAKFPFFSQSYIA